MGNWRRGIIFGLAMGTLGGLFALTPFYQKLETGPGLYVLFHLRGALSPPPQLVVVGINNRTGDKLGLGELPREWPRSIHAQLVDKLSAAGAAVIIFDMDFRQAKNPEADAAFAQAVARAGNVVLFEHLDGRMQPVENAQGRHQGSIWIENRDPPLPEFAQAAAGLGPFPLPKIDAGVDRFWSFKSSASDSPTMPVVGLQLYAKKILAEQLQQTKLFSTVTRVPGSSQAQQLKDWMLAQRERLENNLQPALQQSQNYGQQLPSDNCYGPWCISTPAAMCAFLIFTAARAAF